MATNNDLQKKQVIKTAAKDLFFRFGFGKTSMEDIARQSGLAKPTLYYYYANKQEIFNAVVIDEAGRFMDKVEQSLPPDLPADQKITLFFQLIYKGLKKYASEMSRVPDLMYDSSPHGKPIVEAINKSFAEKLCPLLLAGKQQGLFDFEDENITTSTLVFMTDFLNLEWIRQRQEEIRDQVVERMIEIILNGLKRSN
jgi:AcrR family transcriptional regulator